MSQCMICLEEGNVRQYCKCEKETSLMHLECMQEFRWYESTCRFCENKFRKHAYELSNDDVQKIVLFLELVRFIMDISYIGFCYELFYTMFILYSLYKNLYVDPPATLTLIMWFHSLATLRR